MPKIVPISHGTTSSAKVNAPITMTSRQVLITVMASATSAQSSWKFSAPADSRRTLGDWFPLASSATSGATQPSQPLLMKASRAPPKWAISAQVRSSSVAYPPGSGPPGVAP